MDLDPFIESINASIKRSDDVPFNISILLSGTFSLTVMIE